jgi:NADH:ubiquinone oxidoreductase subunit H
MGILDYLFLVLKESIYQKFSFYAIYVLNKIHSVILMPVNLLAVTCYNLLATFGVDSIVMSIKFLVSVSLLIFIRGGLPRYRFDHLTKVG